MRETVEEAGARANCSAVHAADVVRVGQLHLYYRARMLDTTLAPGPETIEARLFSEEQVPWDAIAFRTVRVTLEHYWADRKRGHFAVHAGDVG